MRATPEPHPAEPSPLPRLNRRYRDSASEPLPCAFRAFCLSPRPAIHVGFRPSPFT